jgi:hypothetical protein
MNDIFVFGFTNKCKHLTLSQKQKPPSFEGGSVCFVELAGVEPASNHGDHMLSTCLFLLDFRDMSAAEQPNISLFPVCFAIGSE